MTTREFFRLTLPLEVVVKKFVMAVRPRIQGLRVHIDPVDEGIPHLLELPPFPLTGDKYWFTDQVNVD